MRDNSPLFVCYSPYLREFLIENGHRYEVVGINPGSGYKFWVFIKTPELIEAIKAYGHRDRKSIMEDKVNGGKHEISRPGKWE